jgi:hypothetical protein
VPSGYKQLVHWYSKVESNGSQYQWKQYRNESSNNYSDGGPETVISGFLGYGGKYFMNRPDVDAGSVNSSTTYAPSSASMQPLPTPVWMGHRVFTIFSDTNTANGFESYRTIALGQRYTIRNANSVMHYGPGISQRKRFHVWQNYVGNWPIEEGQPTLHIYYNDDNYIQVAGPSEDLIAVYLCDTPNYADRTIEEIQRPLDGWNNTGARVELNRGGQPNGDYYLVVVANENTQLASKAITLID